MTDLTVDAEARIQAKVAELAKELGVAQRPVAVDEILLETGMLDSAAVVELIVWIEGEFSVDIDQDELSIENFGTIRKIASFLDRARGGR